MNKVLLILLFIWELPQNILAIALIIQHKGIISIENKKLSIIVRTKIDYNHRGCRAVSLGRIIIASDIYYKNSSIMNHEYGHALQSLLLGWLYLPIIGFFSYGNNFFWKSKWQGKKDYYALFPERWADVWGKTDNRRNI
jgi:uncharacterized membrane protein (Fun14 family)